MWTALEGLTGWIEQVGEKFLKLYPNSDHSKKNFLDSFGHSGAQTRFLPESFA
jgi:hypothetical protein